MGSVVACFDAPEYRSYLFPDSADCCCAKSRTAIGSGFLSLRFRLRGVRGGRPAVRRAQHRWNAVRRNRRSWHDRDEKNAGGCSLIVGTLRRYWAVSGERTTRSAERERRASEVLPVFSVRPFVVTGIPSIRNVLHMCVSSIIAREHNCTDSVKPELRDTDIFCFVSERGMKIRPVCQGRCRWKTLGPARPLFGREPLSDPASAAGFAERLYVFPCFVSFFGVQPRDAAIAGTRTVRNFIWHRPESKDMGAVRRSKSWQFLPTDCAVRICEGEAHAPDLSRGVAPDFLRVCIGYSGEDGAVSGG